MSLLEPVILNEVTKLAKSISSQTDTVLLDIPFRAGHSFVEGDVALYDTERGDLHDGRAEFEAYFSPASFNHYQVAAHGQVVGFDERADGSLIVAALFRDGQNPEGTDSALRDRNLDVGYRSPSGAWQYATLRLPYYDAAYNFRASALIAVAEDEYLYILSTRDSYVSTLAVSIRIVGGAPVIGAPVKRPTGHAASTAERLFYLVGDRSVVVVASDWVNDPILFTFSSVDGVVTTATVAGITLPRVQEMYVYQLDSRRLLFIDSRKVLTYIDGVLAVSDITVDWSALPSTATRSAYSARRSRGYAPGTDILPGVFVPRDALNKRCYVMGSYFGGYTFDGATVKIYPPLVGGFIADDFIYYSGPVPAVAVHPLFSAGVGGSEYFGSRFVRNGLSASISVNTQNSLGASYRRVSIGDKYVTGGIVFIRQGGESVPAPIGAGGKVIAFRRDPVLVKKGGYVDVAGMGMLARPSFSAGRVRYPGATVYLRIRSLQDPEPFVDMAGPVYVSFPAINSYLTTLVKFWTCRDGQWSAKGVVYTTASDAAARRPDAAFAAVRLGFYWDFPAEPKVINTSPDSTALTLDVREAFL